MDVHVVVARDGDGWLVIDTDDWLSHKLGEPDPSLTADLLDWAADNNVWPSDCDVPARWATERFVEVRGPEAGDPPATFNSANSDTLLSQDICAALIVVRDDGIEQTLAVIDHRDVYVLDPAQEWSDVIDWSRAWGRCTNGHTYTLEGACYLHSDQDTASYRLTELCCEHDTGDGGYIACPDCDHPIEFTA